MRSLLSTLHDCDRDGQEHRRGPTSALISKKDNQEMVNCVYSSGEDTLRETAITLVCV